MLRQYRNLLEELADPEDAADMTDAIAVVDEAARVDVTALDGKPLVPSHTPTVTHKDSATQHTFPHGV